MSGDHVHNENSGAADGVSFQARDVHGDVTVQQRTAGADELLAGDLAGAVRGLSRKEEEQSRIGDPAPLSVRWHQAEQDLFDYWENIQAKAKPERAELVSLSGQFTAIRETFEVTGSQRLLVLGRAGAGKTVLAHRLILDLLEHRDHRAPVPVLFSLNDWNPTTIGLRDWMAERLVRDHPFLEQHEVTGKRSAESLVDRDWILPVLDGFDELPEQHHRAAISEINRVQWPLMVTSRPTEYARAARDVKAVGRAAAIELEDLALAQAEHYLRRSTTPARAAEWEAVFEHLRAAPQETASRNLTSVVTTPLMVMLARTTYNDTNARSAGELLDTTRFPTSTDLEQHLLGGYVDTVYTPGRSTPSGTALPAGDPEQARHWLGVLATGLRARNTHDLIWWQLPTLLNRPTRILIAVISYGLVLGLASGLTTGLVEGVACGLMTGFVFGLLIEAGFARGRAGREPERLRPYWRRSGRRRRSKRAFLTKAAVEFSYGITVGLAVVLAVVLALGFANGLVNGHALERTLAGGLVLGLALGLMVGLVLGLVNIVVSVLGESHDPHDSDPWQLLTTDRRVTVVRMSTAALVVPLVFGCWGALENGTPGLVSGIVFGLALGVFGGVVRLIFSAWGNWLLFTRLWLPLTGRLPWRPKRFLEDAHDRGVLRRAGAAYQFRHAQLRDHLAEHHRKSRKAHPPTPGPATIPE